MHNSYTFCPLNLQCLNFSLIFYVRVCVCVCVRASTCAQLSVCLCVSCGIILVCVLNICSASTGIYMKQLHFALCETRAFLCQEAKNKANKRMRHCC